MLGFTPLAGATLASAGDVNTREVFLLATEAPDVVAINLDGSLALYIAASEAADTVSFNVNGTIIAYIETTEASDTASVVVFNTNVNISATEAQDIAAIVANVTGSLSMAAAEAPDGFAQKAYVLWLDPTEPDDPSIWVPKNDPTPYLTTVI